MTGLRDKFVVLGVSGGIAAYRTCELARLLVRAGAEVQPILTEYAARFVGPLTFQALCGRPAEVGSGGQLARSGMEHIDLSREADLCLVAPATANTLAKVACGLADNLLTTTLLACTCPVVLAPAMNSRMWRNPVTAANIARLRLFERFALVGPGSGELACGEQGPGRMAEPTEILYACQRALGPADLAGRRLLITAGPTREALDPIRFLSNRSSGKMGYALAAAAARRGAEVVLISGPCALATPYGVERVDVVSAAEMAAAVERHLAGCQAVIMAAAVADYRPRRARRTKIKKADGGLVVDWVRTRDILAGLGRRKGRRVLVGFAAETGDPVAAARRKLEAKKLDLVVANDVSRPDAGFAVDSNQASLVDREGVAALERMSKDELADRILDRLLPLLPAGRARKRR